MEVFVLVVRENDFEDVSCYNTEEKAIDAIITDIKDRNNFGIDEQSNESVMEIIAEMKSDIDDFGYWEDEENVRYDIHKCGVK